MKPTPDPLSEDARLTAYALGELSPEETARLEERLAHSPEARQEIGEIREVAGLLERALARELAHTSGPTPPAGVPSVPPLAEEVQGPPAESSPRVTQVPAWRFRPALWLTGMAAAFVAAAGLWWIGGGLPLRPQAPTFAMGPAPRASQAESGAEQALPPAAVPAPLPADPHSSPEPAQPFRSQPEPPSPGTASGSVRIASSAPADSIPVPEQRTPSAPPTGVPTGPRTLLAPALANRYGLAPSPTTADDTLGGVRVSARPQPQSQAPPTAVRGLASSSAGLAEPASQRPAIWLPRDPWGEPAPEPGPPPGANPGYVDPGTGGFSSSLRQPLSTFGLDVDTGSYANVRRFLRAGHWPPAAAVRVEEMVNYFAYGHPRPRGDEAFSVQAQVAACPWEPRHRLVRLALRARGVEGPRPSGNLVFLVDVSGSMRPPERLPLLKQALRALVKKLSAADRVAIVTYSSHAGIHLESTTCEEKDRILESIDLLEAGGSTHGEGGIRQAYEMARRHFIPGGVNRVLLCTDGDFNVGMSDQGQLVQLIEEQARSGVFLTALGVGTDNFKDALMRQLADRGNGSHHYLDSAEEAQRVLLDEMEATFITVARDAKAQVEFNPALVGAWRLIGYEKRQLQAQDFNDDTKDAGEIGAGQSVTVLYELVPAGERIPGTIDPLRYQPTPPKPEPAKVPATASKELLTLKLRYQRPEGSRSVLQEVSVLDRPEALQGDFQFAAAVAAFGQALKDPRWSGGRGLDLALELARGSLGEDVGGWRAEFLSLVRKARGMPRP